MTMTLEQVRDWLEPRYKNQPDDVYDAVDAAIRERADLWSKWQTERCFRAKAESELATAQNTIDAQQDTMGALKRKLALVEAELAAVRETSMELSSTNEKLSNSSRYKPL